MDLAVSFPPRRVLAIAGSLRRDSFNRRLLQAAATLAPAGMQVQVHDGLAALPMFDEDIEGAMQPSDAVPSLWREVAQADALLIATPEYNQSLPGVLKNAIDWMSRSRPSVLAGKPVAVVGATSGRWGTRLAQAALRQVLVACQSRVVPGPSLFLADAAAAFDGEGRLLDAAASQAMQRLLAALDAEIAQAAACRS